MANSKGISLNIALIVVSVVIILFLSGATVYLNSLSVKDKSTNTTNNIENPRTFSTPIDLETKQTRVTIKSINGDKNVFYIHGTTEGFDGETIKVSWKGDTDSIDLWKYNDNELISIVNNSSQYQTVKKGNLKLNIGDYVSYQTNDKILFIQPK